MPATGLRHSEADRNRRCRGRVRPDAAIQPGNARQGTRAAAHFGGAVGVIVAAAERPSSGRPWLGKQGPIGPRMTWTCI